MYIRCNPIKTEETIQAVQKLAVGGDLKVDKVVMAKEVFVELFGEPQFMSNPDHDPKKKADDTNPEKIQVAGRTKDTETLSCVPVEFSGDPGKDAFVVLGNSIEPEPQKKSKAKK